MTTTTNHKLLSIVSCPVKVKMSESLVMRCVHCFYVGHAQVITGRSTFAIYVCPKCRTVAQIIRGG